MANIRHDHKHILSKGAHLIVPHITDARHVITSFSSDGRLFFALPMAGNTCVGTTDEIVKTSKVEVNDADRDFILGNINKTLDLAKPMTKDDIIAERCGVRPLVVSADAGINTGNEVCEELEKAGVKLDDVGDEWFGESLAPEKNRLLNRQKEIEDKLEISPEQAKTMIERWWRYYDISAHDLIDLFHPQSRFVYPEHNITDTEVEFIRETEMALTDRDIRRRRTNLAMAEGLKAV